MVREVLGLEKCTKQHAPIAERNAKFHSSQRKAELFIAKIATQSTENHENSKILTI